MTYQTYEQAVLNYLLNQLKNIVPDGINCEGIIGEYFLEAMSRTRACLKSIRQSQHAFDYLVSWHHSTLIYMLSRTIWENTNNNSEAVRLFILNKALNGIDLFYEIKLGNIFLIGHTLGVVFAKADYGNYCVFHQGCTVGRQDKMRPTLGDGIIMFPGSRIIGNCLVRENTVISAGVNLINTSTPGNCFVFEGKGSKPVFKEINEYYADRYFIRDVAGQE